MDRSIVGLVRASAKRSGKKGRRLTDTGGEATLLRGRCTNAPAHNLLEELMKVIEI